jgi:hypothetical protein
MPIHDWSRVSAGIFHDFHEAWIIELRNALNRGRLPAGFFAMADQIVDGPIPDVITLQQRKPGPPNAASGGVAVADAPPQARFVRSAEPDIYASRANRIAIRHELGDVVAMIEIISPGNKNSVHALRTFVQKAQDLLYSGVNLLIVDLFPPTVRDPQGIHKQIWDTVICEDFELPADKPLTVAAYAAGVPKKAYVEPVAVGDPLPPLPIFLHQGIYVPAPLDESYAATWDSCPEPMKQYVLRAGT